MPADHAPQQPVAAEPVQAPLLAVALAGGEDEGQVAGFGGLEIPRLQTGEQRLGNADTETKPEVQMVSPLWMRASASSSDVTLLRLLPAADATCS